MSSLSMLRGISVLLFVILLAGCETLRTREEVKKPQASPSVAQPGKVQTPGSPSQLPPIERDDDEQVVTESPPPAPVIPAMPKIGLILGAGGARTFAHIGFLHELAKLKVPISAIGGVEFAAPMAALYANKELANDVEWQMFKLKEDDFIKKSLLGGVEKNIDVTALKSFVSGSFSRVNAQDFRLPFACPVFNLPKNQVYLMNRGSIDQVLYSCMAYPPYFKGHSGNLAGVREIPALAAHLRQRGANFIVLVNVLPPPQKKVLYGGENSTENVLWSEIAGSYNKPFAGVDSIISLDAGDYGIMDFSRRREIMNKGSDSAARTLKTLTRKWGF